MTAELAASLIHQRQRAEGIADLLRARSAAGPRIDPAEWRGAAALAERMSADRMLERLSAAAAAAAEVVEDLGVAVRACDA